MKMDVKSEKDSICVSWQKREQKSHERQKIEEIFVRMCLLVISQAAYTKPHACAF